MKRQNVDDNPLASVIALATYVNMVPGLTCRTTFEVQSDCQRYSGVTDGD